VLSFYQDERLAPLRKRRNRMKKFLEGLKRWASKYAILLWLSLLLGGFTVIFGSLMMWTGYVDRTRRYETLEHYCEKNGYAFSPSDIETLEGISNIHLRGTRILEWEDRCKVPREVRVYR
jgi:hypothetical protein